MRPLCTASRYVQSGHSSYCTSIHAPTLCKRAACCQSPTGLALGGLTELPPASASFCARPPPLVFCFEGTAMCRTKTPKRKVSKQASKQANKQATKTKIEPNIAERIYMYMRACALPCPVLPRTAPSCHPTYSHSLTHAQPALPSACPCHHPPQSVHELFEKAIYSVSCLHPSHCFASPLSCRPARLNPWSLAGYASLPDLLFFTWLPCHTRLLLPTTPHTKTIGVSAPTSKA